MAYLNGPEAFDEFVTSYFVKSRLGHSFEGLQTIPKLLEDAQETLRHKKSRLDRLARQQGPGQKEKKGITEAGIRVLHTIIQRLEKENRHNRSRHLPLLAP